MKHYFALVIILLLLSAVFMAGCTKPPLPTTSPKAPITDYTKTPGTDYTSLVDSLRQAGATVEPGGEKLYPRPIFSVTCKVIKVNGEDVLVLEYDDEAAAEAEAQLVHPHGSTFGTFAVGKPGVIVEFNWIAPPHWYKSGKIIVIYVGENQTMIDLLESLLGKQFAGM